MNRVILTGRIANDLVLKATSTGKSVCDFRLATNRPVNRDGERVADFINCRVWNKTAENLTNYQTKGNLIAVIGRLQIDKFTTKDGNVSYNTYVLVEDLEFLERKKEASVKADTPVKPAETNKIYPKEVDPLEIDYSTIDFNSPDLPY